MLMPAMKQEEGAPGGLLRQPGPVEKLDAVPVGERMFRASRFGTNRRDGPVVVHRTVPWPQLIRVMPTTSSTMPKAWIGRIGWPNQAQAMTAAQMKVVA